MEYQPARLTVDVQILFFDPNQPEVGRPEWMPLQSKQGSMRFRTHEQAEAFVARLKQTQPSVVYRIRDAS